VFLVSHDRAFLDNVVTQTIAYEGNAQWRDYVGGYDDWLQQSARGMAAWLPDAQAPVKDDKPPRAAPAARPAPAKPTRSRLSSWEARELEGLPDAIAALETEQAELTGKLADGILYRDDLAAAQTIEQRL